MSESVSDQSWYDITLEEELEKERKNSLSSLNNVSSDIIERRSFPVLSPLKEADRSLEMKEEMLDEPDIKEGILDEEPSYMTPKKTRLGPRASKRHSAEEMSTLNNEHMPRGVRTSPRRRVKVEIVEASPVSRNVKSRLGPRAASRHSVTPEQTGNKRHLAWGDSPLRDTDHKDKRHRMGTPTRDRGTPTQDNTTPGRRGGLTPNQHVFSTPEPIRNTRRDQRGKFRTPNSDSRIYSKKNQTNKTHLSGAGKDLFGNSSRKRGNSECSKENEPEPLKALMEEQIAKREKQVMYGKVTDGYQNYKSIVPKNLRNIRDPATPKKDYPYSKRCWDGLVRSWRRRLHEWDEPNVALNIRAAYTKNNKDLKESGLITENGEVVMCNVSEPGSCTTEPAVKEELVPEPAEPVSWDLPTLPTLPTFSYPVDDDTKSQDSEYTRLLENRDDFPEDDEDDNSYHLSQDSGLDQILSQEEEDQLMECEDDMDMADLQFNQASVC